METDVNWKRIKWDDGGDGQAARDGDPASPVLKPPEAPAAPPAAPARRDNATEEATPLLYPEDLADLDEFDLGGATFGRKRLSLESGPAAAGDSAEALQNRPLSARDLPRHQQRGLRFVEARPLPLRGQRTTPKPRS